MINIALAGNPNSGKTTLFNSLTGSSAHVGNWPGVTIEKKEGTLKKHKNVHIIDLPGIYSLSPYTLEEVITRDFLTQEKPDLIINVVDASNLERNLFLTTQLLELNIPVVIALNMMDVVSARNDVIHTDTLSKELGCPVVEIIAKHEKGLDQLIKTILRLDLKPSTLNCFSDEINQAIYTIESFINQFQPSLRFDAIKCLERDEKRYEQLKLTPQTIASIDKIIQNVESQHDEDIESIVITQRYQKIGEIVSKHSQKTKLTEKLSDKIDKLLTNKWLGLPIFFLIMGLIYYVSIASLGDQAITFVEESVTALQEWVSPILESWGASAWSIALVSDGIIGSIGAILPFIPQLMILFFFLSILEDTGYMARVAFLMDRIFRKFGLSGRSFIPMLIGTGCSIPGVMASRTIEDETDRRLTIMLTPFVPCGAKIPVFAMFIAVFFSNQAWIAPFIYLFAFTVIVLSGIVLKKTKWFKGDPVPFIMELPDYKLPRLKGLVIHMWDKVKSFVVKAGTVIFISVIVIWFLQNFDFGLNYLEGENIDQSMLAAVGNGVRFFFLPLGFGDSWAPASAALTGMVAKEVVVATLASIGSSIEVTFSQLSAFSFMIFTLLAAPCVAAIGAMRRELGSTKLLLSAILFQTGLAYVMSFLVYQIGSLLLKGTQWLTPVALMSDELEALSEQELLSHNIALYIFGGFLILSLIIIFINWIKTSRHLKLNSSEK